MLFNTRVRVRRRGGENSRKARVRRWLTDLPLDAITSHWRQTQRHTI